MTHQIFNILDYKILKDCIRFAIDNGLADDYQYIDKLFDLNDRILEILNGNDKV